MKTIKKKFLRTSFLILMNIITLSLTNHAFSQGNEPYVRIAKLVIDSSQLAAYKILLKTHATAAVSKEPGVLTLYAVYDKEEPTHVTVFEIYASVEAYNIHIQTPHFLTYKSGVKDMVKSLVLTDVMPIALEAKSKP